MAINDTRLDIIKDVVRTILNQTTHLTDEKLNETQQITYESGSINGDVEVEEHLEYLENIYQLSIQIEKLGRKMELEKRVFGGETIVGDKMKMHWTEDGWVEGEKNE